MKSKTRRIAKVCHEVNRAYCRSIGDDSQLEWWQAPEWQRDSAMKGVTFKLNNPGADPAMMHDSWMQQKVAEGWIYGTEKDPEKKTHPCMLPYGQLPQDQRAKDYLFSAVVEAMR